MTALRVLFLISALMLIPTLCRADANVDAAQREVDLAEKAARRARDAADNSRIAVQQNRTDRDQYKRDLREAESKLAELQQQINSFERQARADHDAFSKIKDQQTIAATEVTRLKKESVNNDRIVEDAKNEALQKFEADPSTLELKSKIEERKANVEAQINRIDSELRKTEPYGKLRQTADTAGAALKQLRENPGTDSQTLVFANQKWMDARNKADDELNKAFTRDKQYGEAIETQTQSKKAYSDATSAFKKSLPQQPQIVVLIQVADQSKADVINADLAKKKIDSSLHDAEVAANKSETKYKNAAGSIDDTKTKRDQAALDLRENERAQRMLEQQSRDDEIAVREAEITLQRAMQKLAAAQQRAK